MTEIIYPLLTIEEASARLNESVQWIYKAVHRGEVPHIKLGKYLRFDEAKLRPYIERRAARRGRVYFITAATIPGFPIKVGWTRQTLAERVKQLQTGSPFALHALGSFPGNQSDEAQIHEDFAQHRLEGEWFQRDALRGLMAEHGIVVPSVVPLSSTEGQNPASNVALEPAI